MAIARTFQKGARIAKFHHVSASPSLVVERAVMSGRFARESGLILRALRWSDVEDLAQPVAGSADAPVVEVVMFKRGATGCKRAVDRTMAKRRLRAAARIVLPQVASAEYLYLIQGLPMSLLLTWPEVLSQMESVLHRAGCAVHE